MVVDNFALWAACQRLFNVTPAVVHDHRDQAGGGTVHFLATLNDADGIDVAESYDDRDLLALGYEDDDQCIRVIAARDMHLNAECIVVVRIAESCVELSCHAMEVTVFVSVTDETLAQAIALVRAASLDEHFECYHGEHATVDPDASAAEPEADLEPSPLQGRSLWDRLMGRSN